MDKITDRSRLAVAGTGEVPFECLVGMAVAGDSVSDRRLSGWTLYAGNPEVLVRGTKPHTTQAWNPGNVDCHHWFGRMDTYADSCPSLDCAFPDSISGLLALVVGEQFAEAALIY